jgi:hypothetical protein
MEALLQDDNKLSLITEYKKQHQSSNPNQETPNPNYKTQKHTLLENSLLAQSTPIELGTL